jgi:hypothetical protein
MVKDKFNIADEKGENFTEENFNDKGFSADNNITEVSKNSDLQDKLQSEDFNKFFDDVVNKDFENAFKTKGRNFSEQPNKEEERKQGFYVSIDENNFKTKVWIVCGENLHG